MFVKKNKCHNTFRGLNDHNSEIKKNVNTICIQILSYFCIFSDIIKLLWVFVFAKNIRFCQDTDRDD